MTLLSSYVYSCDIFIVITTRKCGEVMFSVAWVCTCFCLSILAVRPLTFESDLEILLWYASIYVHLQNIWVKFVHQGHWSRSRSQGQKGQTCITKCIGSRVVRLRPKCKLVLLIDWLLGLPCYVSWRPFWWAWCMSYILIVMQLMSLARKMFVLRQHTFSLIPLKWKSKPSH